MSFRRVPAWLLGALLVTATIGATTSFAALPTNFADQSVVTGLDLPSGFTFLPDGRMIVIEQKTFRVRLVLAGGSTADTTLTITDVNGSGNERGLLGVAIDPAVPVGAVPFDQLPGRVHQAVERLLSHRVYLRAGGQRVAASWRELGATVDETALISELRAIGHSGDLWHDFQRYFRGRRQGVELHLPVDLDEKRAFEYLIELKDQVDRAPVDARLELERHTVAPEKPGYMTTSVWR